MSLNINEVLADMAAAIKGEVGDHWQEVKQAANHFLDRRKARLELLAELRISGDITQDQFESRLEDEKLIAEAEFHAIAVISKAIAQRAANAAVDVLREVVEEVVGA